MNWRTVGKYLYGRDWRTGVTRVGSAKFGVVVLRVDALGTLPAAWLGEVVNVGWSFGVVGAVESGLLEIPREQLRRGRVHYLPGGRALGLYLADRRVGDGVVV